MSIGRLSGTSSEDIIHLATTLLNKCEIKSVQETCDPLFRIFSTWRIIKVHLKFYLLLNPPQTQMKSVGDGELEEGCIEVDKITEDFKLSMGRKIVKSMEGK